MNTKIMIRTGASYGLVGCVFDGTELELTFKGIVNGEVLKKKWPSEVCSYESVMEFMTPGRRPIQQIFPALPKHDRELFLTGMPGDQWDEFLADDGGLS